MERTPKTLPLDTLVVSRPLGMYYRGILTDEFVYFCNYQESDESGQVLMYRKKPDHLELVSDNYFAFVGMMEDLRKKNFTHLSPTMKINYRLMEEAGDFEEA